MIIEDYPAVKTNKLIPTTTLHIVHQSYIAALGLFSHNGGRLHMSKELI